jgi:hypothetical protein
MTAPLFALAVAVLRGWTHAYTWRLDPVLRERRRAEIESDLWEFQQDPAAIRGLSPGLHVLARTLRGVPDDLGWRADNIVVGATREWRVAMVAATAAAVVVAALWVFTSLQHAELPRPPATPNALYLRTTNRLPPPPPPPPPPAPPCQPPSLTLGCR